MAFRVSASAKEVLLRQWRGVGYLAVYASFEAGAFGALRGGVSGNS